QLGSELLAALEKRDADALSQLQTRQEGIILTLTRQMQKAQLEEAKFNLESFKQAKANAEKRKDIYTSWVSVDYLPTERDQVGLLATAVGLNVAAGIFNTMAAGLQIVPKAHVGLFTFGIDSPNFAEAMQYAGGTLQTGAGVMQGLGEILGITAQHERLVNDWQLQRDLATIDAQQIEAQIKGAEWQIQG